MDSLGCMHVPLHSETDALSWARVLPRVKGFYPIYIYPYISIYIYLYMYTYVYIYIYMHTGGLAPL